MNLFYDLPYEIQILIYEFEGFNNNNFKNLMSELNIKCFCYNRVFSRIKDKLTFHRWMSKYCRIISV